MKLARYRRTRALATTKDRKRRSTKIWKKVNYSGFDSYPVGYGLRMKVLIAVDTGSASHEATLKARRLFPGAEHVIVSAAAIAPYMAVDPLGGGVFAMGQSMDSLNSSEDLANEALVSAQGLIGKSTEDSVALGNPGQVICDQAVDHQVDVIVVGRSSKNWFSRIFDPSVSDYVVAHAPCPVLVVREKLTDAT